LAIFDIFSDAAKKETVGTICQRVVHPLCPESSSVDGSAIRLRLIQVLNVSGWFVLWLVESLVRLEVSYPKRIVALVEYRT